MIFFHVRDERIAAARTETTNVPRASAGLMPAASLFRDPVMPSHAQDGHAHERFLLDTYAERRAEERRTRAFAKPRRALRALLTAIKG